MASGKNVVTRVEGIAQPIAQDLGLSIWDIEYVKEGTSWILRIYIDKEEGIGVDDCEAFSRAIDKPLDEEDPISQQYFLEVSSPGIERELKKDAHFQYSLGKMLRVRMIRPLTDGRREIEGKLTSYADGVLTLETEDGPLELNKNQTAFIKAMDDMWTDRGGDEPE
ncbi:MAG TPA: ribosome maturation factor [Ruminococcaceae bacterium]|nr:ribosome maturation factor [Oscillospiraceae bacterium]